MLPEEVPLHLEVLRSVCDALVYSKEEGSIIVFEHLTLDRRHERARKFDAGGDFLEHGTEGQERTHRGAESGVFGFERGQGNLTLEVRLPQDGTSTKRDDVSSSRLRGGRRTIGVAAMETCEVGVDITVKIQRTDGLDNHAHVACAMQVANESLDGGRVASFRVVAEPGDLADGECDVGASVGGQVKEHANNRTVAPRFRHRRSVGIDSKCGLSGWRPIIIAVGHTSRFLDFLDEAFLSQRERAIRSVASEIDAKEVSKRALASET